MKRLLIILILASSAAHGQIIGPAGLGIYDATLYALIPSSTNQATKINDMIDAVPAGSVIRFDRGKNYNISAAIIIDKALTIEGNGATITYTGSTGIPVSIQSSNVTIKNLEVKSTYGTYSSGSALIGTENSSNTSFYSNIKIENCTIHAYTGSGIIIRFTRNAEVIGCEIDSVPYAGVAFYSVLGGQVDNNDIADMTALGTTSSNAYGITINNLSTDSITRDVMVTRNKVYRVPWEGLDTHAGESLTFDNNYVEDCGVGIAIMSVAGRGSNNVKVTNNTIRSQDATGSAISLAGVTGIYYTNAVVTGNVITGQHIRLIYTKSCIVSNNHIYRSATAYGIYFAGDNLNTTVTDNEITDTYSASNVYAIYFDNNNNIAYINGNSIGATSASLTNKNKYGFSTNAASTGCIATIGYNDFSLAATEAYRSTGQHASRFVTEHGTTTAHITTSSTYAVLQTDRLIMYEYVTGGTTITLPAISALNDKREIMIVSLSSGSLTTSLAMYTTTSTNSTTIAAGAKVRLTYDYAAGKIWRD